MKKCYGAILLFIFVTGCGGGGGNPTPGATNPPTKNFVVPASARLKAFNPSSKKLTGVNMFPVLVDVCVSGTSKVDIQSYKVEQGQTDGTFTNPFRIWQWSGQNTQSTGVARDSGGDLCASVGAFSSSWDDLENVPIPFRITLNGKAIPGVEWFTWEPAP